MTAWTRQASGCHPDRGTLINALASVGARRVEAEEGVVRSGRCRFDREATPWSLPLHEESKTIHLKSNKGHYAWIKASWGHHPEEALVRAEKSLRHRPKDRERIAERERAAALTEARRGDEAVAVKALSQWEYDAYCTLPGGGR